MTIQINPSIEGGTAENTLHSRQDTVYMRMAFGLAAASGFYRAFGPAEEVDVPLAAIGTSNGTMVAKGVASDNLLHVDGGHADAHAEGMMIQDFLNKASHEHFPLDTVYTTFEPCRVCLQALHNGLPGLKKIIYGNERTILERKGDVNVRPTVHEFANEWGMAIDIKRFDANPALSHIGESILHSFDRDRTTGLVTIDRVAMAKHSLDLQKLSL